MSDTVKSCGYHGCHIIPPEQGCKCTECNINTGRCHDCAEPRKRADEQFATGNFTYYIVKCRECMNRMNEYLKSK